MRRRFIALALFALLFTLGWWAGRGRASSDLYARLDTFVEILHKIEENYVEPVEPQRLIHGAVHGMLRDLDPYAEYVAPRQGGKAAPAASAGDVGIALGARDGAWVVIAPDPGGPAARAGVRAGDALVQVDGRSAESWSRGETQAALRGAPGSSVKLSVMRAGDETPREIAVTRALPGRRTPPTSDTIEHGIGLVRLQAIDDSTALEFKPMLRRLRGSGVTRLVLDLRGCTSGTLRAGGDVAQVFLARGQVVARSRGRGRDSEMRRLATDAAPVLDWPMVVIVDRSCAGASEVIAGALQDDDRGLLVGATTFGLAATQSDFPLEGGDSRVRLTTALQLTPSGRPIQGAARPAADEEDDSGAPDSAAADTTARPQFSTRSGRRIPGGGGIHPDVEIAPASGASAATLAAAESPTASADPVMRRALEVLRRAHAPRDVFAALPSGTLRN